MLIRRVAAVIVASALVGLALAGWSNPAQSESRRDGASASITVRCFVGPPNPPYRSGSTLRGFGAIACDGPVFLGIRVCIARNGVKWECSPSFTGYRNTYRPAFSTSWSVGSTGCVRGIYYSTVVEVTAQAANIALKSKESVQTRPCG